MNIQEKSQTISLFWKVIIAICILIPICIGIESAYKRYQSSKQSVYVHQYWLPANVDVSTDYEEWLNKTGGSTRDSQFFRPEVYERSFENEKHFVLLSARRAMYATLHGKIALLMEIPVSNPPRATVITESKYLGNGKVEMQLKRDWFSLVARSVVKGVVVGVLFDLVIVILGLTLWNKLYVTKLKRKYET